MYAFDQRGWGRSVKTPSQRGLTGGTPTILDDITSMLKSLIPLANHEKVPLFLMGHSMGGAEILQYAACGPEDVRAQIRGYLAESPYLTLHPSSQPSRFTVATGKLAARIMPKKQMVQKLESKWQSRDPAVNKEWADDELCHDTGTFEGLEGMIARGNELDKDIVVVRDNAGQGQTVSVWIGHGNGDRVTSYEASKNWFDRLDVKDKEFKTYEGWYHKCMLSTQIVDPCTEGLLITVHAEPGDDKVIFANDVADWILARVGTGEDLSALGSKSKL